MTIIFLINGSAAWEVAFFLSLALFIGILLFGQGQSEATFKSKAVRFGGPAAVVFVILMVLTTRNPSFAFTVTLKMDKSNPPIREGTAQLDIGEQQLSAKIESGKLVFKGIPSMLRGKNAKLSLQVPGYLQEDKDVILSKEVVDVEVKKDPAAATLFNSDRSAQIVLDKSDLKCSDAKCKLVFFLQGQLPAGYWAFPAVSDNSTKTIVVQSKLEIGPTGNVTALVQVDGDDMLPGADFETFVIASTDQNRFKENQTLTVLPPDVISTPVLRVFVRK